MGKFAQGSTKQTGNISDNKLSSILGIPTRTLNDWKKSENWRKTLYFFLKSMNENEINIYLKKSQVINKNTYPSFEKLRDTVLIALWDSNGYKTHEEVKDTLKDKVFTKIPKESFEKSIQYLRVSINTLPKSEQELFEEALRELK